MAIENTYLLGKNITLGCGFDLQAKAPLDSRQTVPSYAGLQALIDGNAAYEGMIVYDEETKKTYQAQLVDGALAFREFGINEAELKDLIASETTAAMEFKGVAAALPTSGAKGDMYKVSTAFTVEAVNDAQAAGFDAKVGDSIVCDGDGKWFLIPSGDDIEDTWRPVTDVANDATLTFAAGDKLDVTVASNGTITYSHEAMDAPVVTPVGEGEQTRTYITEVTTDGHGHITGYKTATENVEDTNTEYTFEGQSDEATSVYFQVTSNEEGASAEVIYLDAYSKNEADSKFVTKETGKSLVSDVEIARLANVDNYDDEEVRGLIGGNSQAIEDLETYVGTIPTDEKYADITNVISYINKKAEETLAAAQGGSSETAASVKQQLDNYKSENDTRVKAVEDDIDTINNADTGILKQAKDYADGLAGNYDEKGAAAGVQTALETEIAKKVDKESYEADKATFATKTELGDVDKKFENYRTSAEQDVIDNGHKERIEALESKFTGDDSVDAKIASAVDAEKQRAEGIEGGLRTDVNAVAGRMDTAEGKIATLETESAKHALKTEVEAVDAKFADYNTTVAQKAIDDAQDARIKAIEDDYLVEADIANFETKANVQKVADDLAAYVESNNAAVADRYTKAEADGKFALIADAYDDEEVRGLISANADAIAAEKTRAEGIEGGLRTDVDSIKADYLKAADISGLQSDVSTLKAGAETEGSVDYKIAQAVAAIMENPDDTMNSINELVTWVNGHAADALELSNQVTTNKNDIADLKTQVGEGTVKSQIETAVAAEAEIARAAEGALSDRVDVLEKIDHEAYVAADTALKTELTTEIGKKADASVVEAMDAAYKAADVELSAAIEAAKTDASNKDAVVLSEAQKYADQAEADAIVAAEAKVNALAEGQVATNTADIADIMEMLTWGSF